MPHEDAIIVEGRVVEVLRVGLYRAELINGHRLLAHSSGRDMERASGLALDSLVRLEMSPFDMSRGRILFE